MASTAVHWHALIDSYGRYGRPTGRSDRLAWATLQAGQGEEVVRRDLRALRSIRQRPAGCDDSEEESNGRLRQGSL